MSTPKTTNGPHDVLDGHWDDAAWWSTANLGEAVPGVLTPLNWTFWGPASERGLRDAFVRLGALETRRAELPDHAADRIMGIFHGRFAAKVSFLGEMGDRIPGTSGAAVAEQILGALPPGFVSHSTLSRVPAIAWRLPGAASRAPGGVRRLRRSADAWWRAQVVAAPDRDLESSRACFQEARDRFREAMADHIVCVFAVIQPIYGQINALVARAGDPTLADRLLAGQGMHAELEMVEDLWLLSRAQLDLDAFLDSHGYHGPNEGEIAARVWREDPGPVRDLVRRYALRGDDTGPEATLQARASERRGAEQALLRALPAWYRPTAKLVLELAKRLLPLRGYGKVAYLQMLDVARASVRRSGELLVEAGTLNHADDAAFLTAEELCTVVPGTLLQDVVTQRRREHAMHAALVLPHAWRGRPDVLDSAAVGGDRTGTTVSGVGACAGIVEGIVSVVLDPSFGDVEDGRILVAPFTDPSWASMMFTSVALVVDIGTELSHAAVVARELGVPCVMGTGDGTRRLRDGDRCRVDGSAGTVHLLEPAEDTSSTDTTPDDSEHPDAR